MFIVQLIETVRAALAHKRGAAMIEYALLVGLIAIVAAGVLGTLGTSVKGAFTSMSSTI